MKKKSPLSKKAILNKVKLRTATKNDYRRLSQIQRLDRRRKEGVRSFWEMERERILAGETTTRNWNEEQLLQIISGKTPQFNEKPIQGHHTYSVHLYPHLANKGNLIFPVTHHEHLYGWHGGNFSKSVPSLPIKLIRDF